MYILSDKFQENIVEYHRCNYYVWQKFEYQFVKKWSFDLILSQMNENVS